MLSKGKSHIKEIKIILIESLRGCEIGNMNDGVPGDIQNWSECGDYQELQHEAPAEQGAELGHRLRQAVVRQARVKCLQDVLQLGVVVLDGELVHLGVMAVHLQEGEDAPHEVVTQRPKEAALPVDQHRLDTFAGIILELVLVELQGDLAEHEVVWLGVAVAERGEVAHPRLLQHLAGRE